MKIAKIIALIDLIAMTGILIFGFTLGNFSAEGSKLLAMPWGSSTLLPKALAWKITSQQGG